MRGLRKMSAVVAAVAGLTILAPPDASAYEPVNVVHTERVQAGPYGVTVGFSVWPLRAMQSLDFTFVPDGGVDGKSGVLTEVDPTRRVLRAEPLARHPRKRDVWGLDVRSLKSPGEWTFRFRIDGPLGPGAGELAGLTVLPQPGPPLPLSWSISVLPLIALVAFLVVVWRRTGSQAAGGTPAA